MARAASRLIAAPRANPVDGRIAIAGRHVRMEIRPLIAFRDFHALTHENLALDGRVEVEQSLASIKPYTDLPTLHFAHDAETLDPTGFWFRQFRYDRERERGVGGVGARGEVRQPVSRADEGGDGEGVE